MEKNKRKLLYSPAKLKKAIKLVRDGKSAFVVGKEFNIPRTTILDKVNGRRPDNVQKPGPKPMLGTDVEETLAAWLIQNCKKGFPLNKDSLLFTVKKLIDEGKHDWMPRTFNFEKGPGRAWLSGFMNRHKDISVRQAEYLHKGRACASEVLIRKWFDEVATDLKENVEILDDPRRIFICDETSISLELKPKPKAKLVFAQTSQRNVFKVSKNSDKDNVTVLIALSAAAEIAPPMAIFAYSRIPPLISQNAPKHWVLGRSESGWMTAESFYEYITNVFNRYLEENGIPKPIVLFLDGHKSYLSLLLSQFCQANGIIIVTLPPNSTHIMQPLDISFFTPLKSYWKDTITKFRMEQARELGKHDVPSLINKLLTETEFKNSIKNGFRECGLYPYDANSVAYSRCIEDSTPNTETSINSNKELLRTEFLKYFTDVVPISITNEFERHSISEWTGDVGHTSLFQFWKHLKYDTELVVTEQCFDYKFQGTSNESHFVSLNDDDVTAPENYVESVYEDEIAGSEKCVVSLKKDEDTANEN